MTILGLPVEHIALFTVAALLLAITPGPVWLYLISRTLTQGRRAGYFSMLGVAAGLSLHVLLAAFGLTIVLLAIPFAFEAIKLAGAAYLLWLAITTIRGAGLSLSPQKLDPVPDRVLLQQAFVAALVNPKVAVFYLSLFPQFVDPATGSVLLQSVLLGAIQILTAAASDVMLVSAAGLIASWLARRETWLKVQRWFLGGAFAALAVWLATTTRNAERT